MELQDLEQKHPALDLADGLWLERRALRLHWYSSLQELRATTTPDFVMLHASGAETQVAWNDGVWGGLACQISTSFSERVHSNPWLSGIQLFFWPPGSLQGEGARFRWLQGLLIDRFGPADSLLDNDEEGRAIWQIGKVTLRNEYIVGFGSGQNVFVFV